MKNNIKILTLSTVLVSMGFAGCNDLDTFPESSYVLNSQKEEAIAANPELGSAGVVGISSTYPIVGKVYSESYHFDFGWPAVMMFLESMGADFVSRNIGYNWFSSGGTYNLGTAANYVNQETWYMAYKIIKSSNDLLLSIDSETEDGMLKLYAAQGYANRAYMYMILAQLFQYTYVGHEDYPCIPIVTDLNSDAIALEGGAPRATVKEVYEQILSDLDNAIEMLSTCGQSVSDITSVGSRRFASLGTAYGLRARANLIMNNWSAAASDAEMAIQTSGCTPLSISEASRPGFWNSDDHNCMWAVYITESDRAVTSGIINYASHYGSFNSNGYWTVGAFRLCNKALYNSIATTDARKGWWLDANGKSKNLTSAEQSFITAYSPEAYMQVKFGPYNDVLGTTTNANDFFLMRIEEMYLIKAEATAMAGDPASGKQILEDFVQTYRDPSYTCQVSAKEDVQEAVYQQRRIELWGEGFSYLDLLRLNKGLDRRGGGWEAVWCYNVEAPLKPLLIPTGEMNANKLIGSNNDSWSKPTAVDDI